MRNKAEEHAENLQNVLDWIERDRGWHAMDKSGWLESSDRIRTAMNQLNDLHKTASHSLEAGIDDAVPGMAAFLTGVTSVAAQRHLIEVTITGPTKLLQACCDALSEADKPSNFLFLNRGLTGHISPMSRVTLPADELRKMGVPPARGEPLAPYRYRSPPRAATLAVARGLRAFMPLLPS